MGTTTKIEWTDNTWSPIRVRVKMDAAAIAQRKGYSSLIPIALKMAGRIGPHCEHVSPGCENCYAETNNHRCLPGNGTGLPYDRRSRDLVKAFIDEKILLQPLKWKQPKRIFVENQSDLFGEWVPDELIDCVFAVMAHRSQHTFQVLTKRPERMLAWITADGRVEKVYDGLADSCITGEAADLLICQGQERILKKTEKYGWVFDCKWPLPNVHLGVSCENQETADERIPSLLQTPAALRFISVEPLLGPVDLRSVTREPSNLDMDMPGVDRCRRFSLDVLDGREAVEMLDGNIFETAIPQSPNIDWVIAGGESGPGARPCDVEWIRSIVQQCEAAETPCFVKQMGSVPMEAEDAWRARPMMRLLSANNAKRVPTDMVPLAMSDKKGGNIEEFPVDLRVREFPEVRA